LEELAAGIRSGVLSDIQVDIITNRASNRVAWTYPRLVAHYRLSGPNALVHVFVRTACARFWAPGMPGGRDAYLGPLDLARFREQAIEQGQELGKKGWTQSDPCNSAAIYRLRILLGRG
jgi:hypothetical protein